MEQSTCVNICILVTVTHVKEQKNRRKKFVCEHDDHVGYTYMYKFMQ